MAKARTPVGWRRWLAAARTPAMLGALVGLLAIAFVCGLLGRWQLSRAEQQAAVDAAAELLRENQAGPAPLTEVLQPQQALKAQAVGRLVSATGSFEPGGQLLVPGRQLGEREGFLVLAPLRLSDGSVLPVVRGWVGKAAEAPPAPAGELTVTGTLAPSEASSAAAVPAGQIMEISSAELVGTWGGPIYPAYLVADKPDAGAGDLELLPAPTSQSPGWRLQNLFYAIEWWVFGAFAVILWWRLVRDRARQALPAGASVEAGAH